MRVDPGNFLLGHPANKKSEMGSGLEGLEGLEVLEAQGLAGWAGSSSAEPNYFSPPPSNRTESKPKCWKGWRASSPSNPSSLGVEALEPLQPLLQPLQPLLPQFCLRSGGMQLCKLWERSEFCEDFLLFP